MRQNAALTLAQRGYEGYRLAMKWMGEIPVPGTCTNKRRLHDLACLLVGVVLAHMMLMMSGPHALADGNVAHAHPPAHEHSPMSSFAHSHSEERESVEMDHHCAPLTGDLKRLESGWSVTHDIEISPRLERVAMSAVPARLDPHPPDRSLFQVFRI